jgi:hypothetical protein
MASQSGARGVPERPKACRTPRLSRIATTDSATDRGSGLAIVAIVFSPGTLIS